MKRFQIVITWDVTYHKQEDDINLKLNFNISVWDYKMIHEIRIKERYTIIIL